MTQALSSEALHYACQRVEDFALIHRIRAGEEREESIDIWLDSVGLDEPLRLEFAQWVEKFVGSGWDGAIMIGFLVGLFINQFNHDHP